MAVFRVERNRGYTVMSNHHLRNRGLTLKAKGLLSQMLSLPDNWDYTLAGLSHINREKSTRYAKRYESLKKPGISSAAANETRKDACGAQTISFTSSRSHLYRIYLHWKIQHWIIQRWKNLCWKILRWKTLRWKIQRN